MSDELKPQASIDSGAFRELLWDFQHHPGSVVAINALIAHIDAWGTRFASDAMERAAKICDDRAMFWQAEETTYAAGKKAGAFDAAEHIRRLAGPATDKGDA